MWHVRIPVSMEQQRRRMIRGNVLNRAAGQLRAEILACGIGAEGARPLTMHPGDRILHIAEDLRQLGFRRETMVAAFTMDSAGS